MNMRVKMSGLLVPALAACVSVAAREPVQDLHKQATVKEADARATALQRAPDGKVISSELEREHGKLVWSFDIARPGSKDVTEILVDARTGAIVSTQVETTADQAREAKADASAHR